MIINNSVINMYNTLQDKGLAGEKFGENVADVYLGKKFGELTVYGEAIQETWILYIPQAGVYYRHSIQQIASNPLK